MNGIPNRILESKIQIPVVNGALLERAALVADMLGSTEKIMVLQGGAGYGKTTLAGQYCHRSGRKTMWYSLDKRDNTPCCFLTYMDLLCSREIPEYHRSVSVEDGQGAWDFTDGVQKFIHNISTAMKASQGDTYTLVLDGFEAIGSQEIYEILQPVIDQGGAELQVILLSRYRMPDSFSKYAVNGTCRVIDETELAFSEEEQRSLISRELDIEPEETEKIFEECVDLLEGWPACMMLALRCIRKRGILKGSIDWAYLLKDSMIGSFFNSEILEKLPEEIRTFLIQTSVLNEVDVKVCDRILHINHSKTIINGLLEKNMFVHIAGEDYGKLRYHGIFRLYLNELAEDGLREQMATRVAEYYLEEKDYQRAMEQGMVIDHTGLIAKIVEIHGEEMLSDDSDPTLALCVDYLERKAVSPGKGQIFTGNVAATPEVLGVAAEYYYKQGKLEKAELCLNQADSSFGKENKYGLYRSLYRGLLKYSENPLKYERQIHNALFSLRENRIRLPYLLERDMEIIKQVTVEKPAGRELKKQLKVNTFGDFQVLIVEEERQLSWRTKKGSELFAYLLELEGRAVGRRQLLQKLWEDEMPDNAVTMLHNMFYNIRKELASCNLTDLIQYKDRMYSINMEAIETDTEEIKYLCSLVDREDTKELEKHSQWFQSYWGRYMEDIDSSWVMEQKEYYDIRFLKGCMLLAISSMKSGDYQSGAVFLKNALLINSYSEELACKLLQCYGAMHNLKQVMNEYNRFCSLLERDLGIKASKALEETYKTIIGG